MQDLGGPNPSMTGRDNPLIYVPSIDFPVTECQPKVVEWEWANRFSEALVLYHREWMPTIKAETHCAMQRLSVAFDGHKKIIE